MKNAKKAFENFSAMNQMGKQMMTNMMNRMGQGQNCFGTPFGGMPDMRLDVTPHIQVNQAIEKVIDEIQPDTVFTHFYGDVNLDHQCVFKSVMVAVRPVADQVVQEVYCFNVPSSTEWNVFNTSTMFMPNMVVNIADFAEQKYAALAEYKTELREYPHPRSIEHVRKQDEAEGLKAGLLSAESFMLVRKVVR